MPAITDVEFFQFSAHHHNAQRNWLMLKLETDDPRLYGLGDASPMRNDEQVKGLIADCVLSHCWSFEDEILGEEWPLGIELARLLCRLADL